MRCRSFSLHTGFGWRLGERACNLGRVLLESQRLDERRPKPPAPGRRRIGDQTRRFCTRAPALFSSGSLWSYIPDGVVVFGLLVVAFDPQVSSLTIAQFCSRSACACWLRLDSASCLAEEKAHAHQKQREHDRVNGGEIKSKKPRAMCLAIRPERPSAETTLHRLFRAAPRRLLLPRVRC